MKKYLKEIKEEAALCRKYIDECNISAPKSEHEKLALKVASGCEQTLKALMGEIEKDRWISVDEQMPPEYDNPYIKYKGTDKWPKSWWEKASKYVLALFRTAKGFEIVMARTVDGKWKPPGGPTWDDGWIVYWKPLPKVDLKEEMEDSKEL